MSTIQQFIEDLVAVVADFDSPIRVNVSGDDTDLHVTDITVSPDGVVRIIAQSDEIDLPIEAEVAGPAPD